MLKDVKKLDLNIENWIVDSSENCIVCYNKLKDKESPFANCNPEDEINIEKIVYKIMTYCNKQGEPVKYIALKDEDLEFFNIINDYSKSKIDALLNDAYLKGKDFGNFCKRSEIKALSWWKRLFKMF